MIRNARLVTLLGLSASLFLACTNGGAIDGGSTQNQRLQTKPDGTTTGNGATCTVAGIAWSGCGTTGSGSSSPGYPGPDAPAEGGGTGSATPLPTDPVDPGGNVASPPPAVYDVGDTFVAPDGCNKCKCAPDGVWCTIEACSPPAPPPGPGCIVDGKPVPEGAAVPSPDGCNSCSCFKGQLACTMMACQPTPPPACTYGKVVYNAGDSFPSNDGCNKCSCLSDGNVVCTEMACVNK